MDRRNFLAGSAAGALLIGSNRAANAQPATSRLLRFIPEGNLAAPDPIWTTTTPATTGS